jgi:PmbA protein
MRARSADDLVKLSEIACDAAMGAGANFADASANWARDLSVEVEKNAIKSSDARTWGSISVRAFAAGATGWWRGSSVSEEGAREAGRRAAELAQAAEPDPDFVDLVKPEPYPEIAGLYDERVAALGGPELAGYITDSIDSAREIASDAIVGGGVHASAWESALVNNLGVRAGQRATSVSVSVHVVVRREGDVGSYYEWDAARVLGDLEPDGLGARAAEEALKHLKSRTIGTASLPVVFGPLASSALFLGICGAASAEEVQRDRSFLVGRKGESIAPPLLTLVDDPLIPGGLSSAICDGDGFPHRRITVVEGGVLATYLHSNYTAKKAREENTGHSTRGGIATTNMIPELGEKTAAEIIGEVDDGIYVALGSPYPDTASGQVSALVDAGFRIEKGQLTYPLRNTMVAGQILELLGNLDAISSDYRAEPGMVLPTVRVQGMRVASGD